MQLNKLKQLILKHRLYLIATGIIVLFLFLRLYRIDQSLLFFGDMGRDFLEFQEWLDTGKPPLLGPQTSALPFNQSAVYFYLLMPFYLLTGKSLFATIIASAVIHVSLFLLGLYWLRPYPRFQQSLLILAFIVAIQPQYILQHRYIWNPSFVGLFLTGALFSLLTILDRYSPKRLVLFGLFTALSLSFSYASAPVIIALFMSLLIYSPKHFLKASLAILVSFILLNLTTLAFELRHQFLLTRSLTNRTLGQNTWPILEKTSRLLEYALHHHLMTSVLLLVCMIGIFIWYKVKHRTDRPFAFVVTVFMLSFLLTLVAPFPLHAHYIFGVLVTGAIATALLPLKQALTICLLLSFIWLQPAQSKTYFQKAPRTVKQTTSCVQNVCKNLASPTFVATQSDYHAQHDAKEYLYLLNEAGCQASDITIPLVASDTMVVVSEDAIYSHGETVFNELTLFGPSREIEVITCQPNLKAHILQRDKRK